ncbi:MAG TPA: mechanosensitive ion channel domain-containing protein [Polyangiaceae bacterium]|nr:mechanosensitive ion channel domain-containing protein [Polyangiaceae bacterium]
MIRELVSPLVWHKLAWSLLILLVVPLAHSLAVVAARLASGNQPKSHGLFWTRQISSLVGLFGGAAALFAVWVDMGQGKALPLGLLSAGIAVALQKVWTSFAGYLVLLSGRIYTVGDRVSIAGVRGDVLGLGFLYTRILEMGDPAPPGQRDIWVGARQFTGRIVTLTNDTIFDVPVFNYTREFPFLFEELIIPIKYGADRQRAETILLRAAEEHTKDVRAASPEALKRLADEYQVEGMDVSPHVYYRLTDNWVELTLRFLVGEHGIRELKDRMSRDILRDFEAAKLSLASGTYEIVGLPTVHVETRE